MVVFLFVVAVVVEVEAETVDGSAASTSLPCKTNSYALVAWGVVFVDLQVLLEWFSASFLVNLSQ